MLHQGRSETSALMSGRCHDVFDQCIGPSRIGHVRQDMQCRHAENVATDLGTDDLGALVRQEFCECSTAVWAI